MKFVGVMSIFLLFSGCARAEQDDKSAIIRSQETAESAPFSLAEYDAVRPESFSFKERKGDNALYELDIEGSVSTRDKRVKVFLDKTLPGILQQWKTRPEVFALALKKRGPQDLNLPDGFVAARRTDSLGFDSRRNNELYKFAYVNAELGIDCKGNRPGDITCIWEFEGFPHFIQFNSDMESEVLTSIVGTFSKRPA